ncbi:related to DNA ligase [Melanopsichium pennsylvanicum]|uniref:Related to DNA ligase n=1 Tax=Melanopsichium pennsylvanicum TaxID=63383 RepID=A0AAJ4XL35_9BASI|nr:related to DNA ligase [Melanopsichium pennsylvanicum]
MSMLKSISMADVIDLHTAVLHIPKMIRQDEYGYRTSVDGKDVAPLTAIPLNNPFRISKPDGAPYSSFVLKRFADGYYVCSCPAWKFSTVRDKMRKTCTHLMDVLGENYENERIALAKEAKSNIFEHINFRRTTSDGHHARHMQAKSLLDDHFKHLSHSQPDLSPSRSNNTASTSAAQSTSNKLYTNEAGESASSTIYTTNKPPPALPKAKGMQGDSDTETENEEVSLSQAAASRPDQLSIPIAGNHVSRSSYTRTRPAYVDSDDENFGFDPDDVQISPSKRARRGRRTVLQNDDDDKPWLLDADPTKPRSKPMDPTEWWISEKLDGVRAFWDGQRLYSRQKIEWNAPPWWKNRLPKDITLDGELWMKRGTFDQTSQICRTTVRLGRLRTFSHFLERDSMERQWLREQAGGRLASQDRLRAERLALSSMRSSARSRGAGQRAAATSLTPSHSGWKAWKRTALSSNASKTTGKKKSKSKDRPVSRPTGQRSFLRVLFGRSKGFSSTSFSVDLSRSYRPSIRRCTVCGKIVKLKKPTDNSTRVDLAISKIASQNERANADQPLSVLPLPSLSVVSTPNHLQPASTFTSSRRPHIYSLMDASRSARTILPAYTHVCRRKLKSSNEWHNIKFMIFDAPSIGSRPVEERWAEIEERFGSTDGLDIDLLEGPQIKLVKHIRCEGRDHMIELMKSVELKGGEGLMLRQPKSKYEGKRGNTLYKLKSWYDAEAEVIGYAEGNGRHEGRTGALVARMECGTVFRVGTGMSDAMRENPPPLGSIINYRFFELSEDGNPRFPAFRGISRDKSRPKDAVVRPRAEALRAAID